MKSAPTLTGVLRKTIAQSGIPLLTLEQETGVARASIMRFVRGDQTLRLDKADALARYFGLRLLQPDTAAARATRTTGSKKRKGGD